MSKKLGLALGSGGARGAAHIGFLQVLDEHNIKPSYIAGSSMGALVGACYAAGKSPEWMKEELFSLRAKDILDIDLLPLTKLGLFKSNKMRELITKHLGDKEFKSLDIEFKCVAVNMLNAKTIVLGDEYNLAESVIASCSIPALFRPVELNGMLLTDGGLVERVPVGVVRDMGAQVIVGVDVMGEYKKAENLKSLLNVMLKTIEIMDHHSTERKKKYDKKITDLWIDVEMGDISQYNIKNTKTAYEAGLKAGYQHLNAIKKLLD